MPAAAQFGIDKLAKVLRKPKVERELRSRKVNSYNISTGIIEWSPRI